MIKSFHPERYTENISRLNAKYESVDPSPDSTRELFSELISDMGGLFGGVVQDKDDIDWWFFRVRLRSSFDSGDKVFDAGQHSYPPSSACGPGRCNLPSQPVFYGSDSYDCAIREMKTPDESRYVLSLWRLPKRKVTYYKFLCGSNITNGRLLEHKMGILKDAHEQNSISLSDTVNSPRLIAFLEGWSDLFLSDSYSISSAISQTLMYTNYSEDCDFVSYGSAVYPHGINFALPTHVADELQLHRVFEIELNQSSGETTWIGCFDPGQKTWRTPKLEDAPHGDPILVGRVKGPLS